MSYINPKDKRIRRENEWTGIIIHHTGISDELKKDLSNESLWRKFHTNVVRWLSKDDDIFVSAHYQIGRFGELSKIVDPVLYESFHAGVSEHYNAKLRRIVRDWNRWAIGIELVGDGNIIDYTESQYTSLISLCRQIMISFPEIHPQCILGHENIAPGRKSDPGQYFNWRRFYADLFDRKALHNERI